MAGYDDDWRDRSGGWSRRRAGQGSYGAGERGQSWGSRRPRSHTPYDAGYLGTEGSFGIGNDFGYPGGEWRRPVRARGFGSRGPHGASERSFGTPERSYGASERSYGTPERRIGRARGWAGRDEGRTRAYNADYGRDYEFRATRSGQPWGYFRGRGAEYGADFDDLPSGAPGSRALRAWGSSGWGTAGRAAYGDDFDQDLGRPRGYTGDADFAGRLQRHYGRTPPDRWPADDPPRSTLSLDDEEVRDSVCENLFQDSFVNPDRIDVTVDRGVVTLRGEVDDFLEARYAWDDAWESPGVRGVINNLTVRTERASDELALPQTRHRGGREAE